VTFICGVAARRLPCAAGIGDRGRSQTATDSWKTRSLAYPAQGADAAYRGTLYVTAGEPVAGHRKDRRPENRRSATCL